MSDGVSFGRWLKQLRAALDLTQETLADGVGCAPHTIRMYESGRRRPSRELAERLADVLHVPPEQRASFIRRARTSVTYDHDNQQLHPSQADESSTAQVVTTTLSNPIVTTKLYRPRPRAGLVSRQRLLHQMNAGLAGALTLIAAPAGSGKTSLVTDWLRELDSTIRVAWLALDATDSEPAHFLHYLLAAVQTIDSARGRHLLPLLGSLAEGRVDVLLPLVINELTLLPEHSIVVLDDYHVIDTTAVHYILQFLLDHLPQQLHLVIVSRVDPPLALSRLRVRGQLTELRMQDLRFTAEEAARFFHDTMHLSLSSEDIAALDRRTEGWIAGLQMAALSLQHRPPEQMAAFIEAFARSHRFVVDYLVEEVLTRQPSHIQRFLLHTSILEQLSGPLCDAVMLGDEYSDEQAYSQLVLEQIERNNVFLLPLGDDRRWYRYHHLFAEVLRSRLRAAVPASYIHTLYLRAAHWYQQQGMLGDAIRYALAAQQPAQAARIIEQHAMELMERNAYGELRGWLEQLPEEIVWNSPRLCLSQASVDVDANPARVESLLQRAAVLAPEGTTDSAAWLDDVPSLTAVIRGILAGRAHRYEEAMGLLEQILPTGNVTSSYLVGMATLQLGIIHLLRGELQEAQVRFASLLNTLARGTVLGGFIVEAVARLGQALMARGQLHEAARLFERMLAQLQEQPPFPTASLIHLALGEIYYEWNDLPRADTHLCRARDLGERFASIDGSIGIFTGRGRVLLAQGDRDGALALARKAQELLDVGGVNTPSLRLLPLGKLLLALGEVTAVQRWMQQRRVQPEQEVTADTEQKLLLLARLLVMQHNWRAVHDLTNRLSIYAEAEGRVTTRMEALILQTLAHLAQEQHRDALTKLKEALVVAVPEGYRRVFVDEGAPFAELLATALYSQEWKRDDDGHGHNSCSYAEQLLAMYTAESIVASVASGVVPSRPANHTASDTSVEPLTEREKEVLHLLALGHSNQAIAEQLVVAVGTVKRHINSILGKLAVQSRLQAVARARELNVL